MRRLYFILCSFLLIASVCNTMEAQSLMQTAKKAEQRAKELKQQESTRYNSIIDSKDLSKYNQFITDYPNSSKTPEIRKRTQEIKLWNEVKSTNTITAYEKYLRTTQYHWYDKDANNSIYNLKKAKEKDAWNKVVATNTIQAYQQYLNDNPSSGYKQDAEIAINRLQGSYIWETIKHSNDIDALQSFILRYPHAQERSIATIRLHELKGCQHYKDGNLGSAYVELSNINRDNVSYSNKYIYDEVMEYNEFSKLGAYSSETSLLSFMRKYPSSKYTTQVSNMIAVAKAINLGDYASSDDYNRALSYAKDNYTKKTVQSFISINKKKQKNHKKAINSFKRKNNGGTLNLGFNFIDFSSNFAEGGRGQILYFNAGLFLRIGNFKDRVQFAVGLLPGVINYEVDNTYDDYYKETSFWMPLSTNLKLNLFEVSDTSNLFIYGQYQYNLVKNSDVQSDMSWGAGFGISWKHFDWQLYYKRDVVTTNLYDPTGCFGTSLSYYFKIL